MLSQQNRLTHKADFDRVFHAGSPSYHALLSVRAKVNEGGAVRFGISCGKRVGSAVVRNTVKRRVRAAARVLLPSLAPAWDILISIRPPGARASVAEFTNALDDLLRRRGMTVTAAERK